MTLDEKRERLADLEAALHVAGGRGVEWAEEIDRLRLDIGRETGEGPFGCRTCGSTEIRAWYPVDEAQGVEILSYDPVTGFEIEYDGITDSGESGENESYWCRVCDDHAETLEELCGLPRPAAASRWLDNTIQFPRLLAEIMATSAMDGLVWDELLASMDITSDELSELFDRAQSAWEEAKSRV